MKLITIYFILVFLVLFIITKGKKESVVLDNSGFKYLIGFQYTDYEELTDLRWTGTIKTSDNLGKIIYQTSTFYVDTLEILTLEFNTTDSKTYSPITEITDLIVLNGYFKVSEELFERSQYENPILTICNIKKPNTIEDILAAFEIDIKKMKFKPVKVSSLKTE